MIRLLAYLGLAVLLLAAAGWAVVRSVPADAYRGSIEAAVRERSGWQLSWGQMRFALTPELAIEMDDVVLTPPGDGAPPVTAKRAVLGVSLLPLAAGEVEVSSVRLTGAEVRLRRSADGRIVAQDGAPMTDPFSALAFGDLSFSDSRLILTGDRPAEIGLGHVRLRWPAGAGTMTVTGVFDAGDGPMKVEALLEQRAALFEGGRLPLKISFEGRLARGSVDGDADMAGGTFEGGLNISAPSARRLAAAFGVMLPGDRGLGAVSVAAAAELRPGEIRLRDAKFTLDAITGGGAIGLTLKDGRPSIAGTLSIDRFDLSPYVSLIEPDGDAPAGWSEAALDLDGLKAFDADLTVRARRATLGSLKFEQPDFVATVRNGRAEITLSRATLYAGLAAGRLSADVTGPEPAIAAALSLSGFDAQSFLADAVDSEALTGRGDLTLSLGARGNSRRAMVRTLSGVVTMTLSDGALNGVDLAAVARSVAAETGPAGATADDATGFASLTADVAVAEGRAVARALSVVTPRVWLDGTGVFDLPARTLWLRLSPQAAGAGQAAGLPAPLVMPFAVSGRWEAPIYQPDWEALREMVNAGQVSEEQLATLPEPARSWFAAAVASGDPLPGLPEMPQARAAVP